VLRARRGAQGILLVYFHGLLGILASFVWAGAVASSPTERGDNDRAQDRSFLGFRGIVRVASGLVAIFALLSMWACNGGFEGAKPLPPTIITQPVSLTVEVGQTGTFSVTATGAGTLTYQWFKNGVAISGATSSSYTTPPAVMGDSGSIFTVTVSNMVGTVTSNGATLTVQQPLAKSLIPSSATPPFNSSVGLVPTFSGGTGVIGSTGVGSSDITASAVSGGSYPTPLLTSAKTYTLTVKDSKGNVASTTCLVTPTMVTITPIVPANQTFAPGLITFTATASGGVTNNLIFSASVGSFNANVWTSPTAVGTFTITATSVDEPAVFVTTTASISAPVIMSQPTSQHVCTGSSIVLSVTATFAASYQWSLNSVPIPGATSATYTVPAAAAGNAGNYSVTVTNGAGSVTSNVAVVAVGSTITSNPANLTVLPTQTAMFAVAAQGLSPFTYQWFQIASGASSGTAIPGATSSTYITPAVDTTFNGDQYFATVTDSCATPLTSSAATLTVAAGNAAPTIIIQPVGETVAPGDTTSFTAVASGTPALAYQWYVIPAGQTTGVLVSGATAASYTVPGADTAVSNDQDQYYVVVTNSFGQAVSQPATLAVGNGIQITQQPVTQYVLVGASATYQVTAVSDLPLTYQWFEATPGSSVFTAIPGATGSTFTQTDATLAESGSVFYVVVSNGSTTSVISVSAGLFVGPLSVPGDLCDTNWSPLDDAVSGSGCSFQLTSATNDQLGEIVWPDLISTGDIQLSFTMTLSNPSSTPADGFTLVFGDPSLGATTTSLGTPGMGLGASGIPGSLFGFDTYHNAGDPTVPYVGVGRSDAALFEKPWFNVNTSIPTLVAVGQSISHDYTISIIQGQMTVTLDGVQVMSGSVTLPPVAYMFFTASTGGSFEQAVISNVTCSISVPSN
jgi:Bacterial lectin/Immunoglobulin I-set domain